MIAYLPHYCLNIDAGKGQIKNFDLQGEIEKEFIIQQKNYLDDFQKTHQANITWFRQNFYQKVLSNILEQQKNNKLANSKIHKIANRLDLRYVITLLIDVNAINIYLQSYYIEFVDGKALPKQFRTIGEQQQDINIINEFSISYQKILDYIENIIQQMIEPVPEHLKPETIVLLKITPELQNQTLISSQLQNFKEETERAFPKIQVQFMHKDEIRGLEKLALAIDNGLADFAMVQQKSELNNQQTDKGQISASTSNNISRSEQIISTIRLTWKEFSINQINGFFEHREIKRLGINEQINNYIDYTIQNLQKQKKGTDSVGIACLPIGYQRNYQDKTKLVGLGQFDECRKNIQQYFIHQQELLRMFIGNKIVLLKSNILRGVVVPNQVPKEIGVYYLLDQAKHACEVTKAEMLLDQQKFQGLGQKIQLNRIADRCFALLYVSEILNYLQIDSVRLENINFSNWLEGAIIHSLMQKHNDEAQWFKKIVIDYMKILNEKTMTAQQDYFQVVKGTFLMMIVLMIIVIYGFYYYSKLGKISEPNGGAKNC